MPPANRHLPCYQAADQDIVIGGSNGNAGGDTIYRLREGIERVLITDINNPAASAMAQSELAIAAAARGFSLANIFAAPAVS